MSDMPSYRYPGSSPFQDTHLDRLLFKGRDKEIASLLHTVLTERIVILFAKSGMGKTSLLNAGLMKQMRNKGFIPFTVRMNAPEADPMQSIYNSIEQTVKENSIDYTQGETATLWQYFKTSQFWSDKDSLLTPVLVLDQFEEMFTIQSSENRQAFVTQLADLVKGRVPNELLESISSEEPFPYSETPPEIKVIISIREDFLGLLEEMSFEIPELFSSRFRLLPLSRKQAERAIVEPATVSDELIDVTSFKYSDDAVKEILDFLCERRKKNKIDVVDEVEPFQLQLICAHIENKVHNMDSSKGEDIVVQKKDLGGPDGMKRIMDRFYNEQLKQLGYLEKRKTRKLFEKELISSTHRRLSRDKETIKKKYKVSEKLLTKLVNSRLLRSEPRLDDTYYEISHDTLIEPILNAQRSRRIRKGAVFGAVFVGWFVVNASYYDYQQREYQRQQDEYKRQQDEYQKQQALKSVEDFFSEAREYTESGNWDKAIEVYMNAMSVADAKTYPEIYYRVGQAYENKGSEDAIKYYKYAIELDPKMDKAYAGMGSFYKNQGDFPKAIDSYKEALKSNKKNANAYRELALLYISRDSFDEAVELFSKAVEIDPKNAYIFDSINSALKERNRLLAFEIENRRSSTTKQNAGNFTAALSKKKSALEIAQTELSSVAKNVENADASYYNRLGNEAFDQKHYTDAVKYYKDALTIDPGYKHAYGNLGNVAIIEKRYTDAIKYFENALRIDSEYAYAYNGLGDAAYGQKRYPDAIKYYEAAIKIDPQNAYAYNELGDLTVDQKHYPDAIKYYEAALKIDPGYKSAYNGLGNVAVTERRYPDAIKYYEHALTIDPGYKYAYNGLGDTAYGQKRYPDAIKYYEAALKIDPQNAYAYNGLGWASKYQEHYVNAIKYHEMAIKIEPNNPSYLDALCATIVDSPKGDVQRAFLLCKKAYDLDSTYRFNLVEVSILAGHFDQAYFLAKEALTDRDVSEDVKFAMKFEIILSLLFQGKRLDAVKELKEFAADYKSLARNYERGWMYKGVTRFIKNSTTLKVNDKNILLDLIDILESPKLVSDRKLKTFEASIKAL